MDNFRLILFGALAFVLFLMWQAWEEDYGVKAPPPAPVTSVPQDSQPQDLPDAPPEAVAPQPQVTAAPQVPDSALKAADRIRVRTDVLRVEIDTLGGDLRQLDLPQFPVSLEQQDTPYRLFQDNALPVFIAQSGLISKREAPTHHTRFTAEKSEFTLAEGADELVVPLTWTAADGVAITKTYTFRRNSYVVDIAFDVKNNSDEAWTGRMYAQFQRTEPGEGEGQRFIYTYTGGIIHSEANRYEKIDFDDMRTSPVSRDETGGWAAMIQHYFAAAWIPDQQDTNHYFAKALPNGRYAVGVVTPSVTALPDGGGRASLQLYVGPKFQDRLEQAAPGLELTVDYGVLTILSEPLFWLLEFINRFVGNWGWSIVILTILIKLAFFHLSATSYKSMANMRRLGPRLQALKERYGDDRAKMNQAMMELYKKEKINPLGGCLPILVQIPVFIALYWVLLESVELRQAPFIFWIRDLSAYDPYFVLPLLMGASMFIQQQLNPAPMDPIQQKIMMVLPIVFTVFFLFFPSGLVLYWFVNNTLSIAQQWVITRRVEKGAK